MTLNARSQKALTTPWMDRAWSHIGLRETKGKAATPAIVEMYAKTGHAQIVSDEVPWCAAFVGACLADAGLPNTGSLMARSYLNYGTEIDEPRVGAIAVFKRGAPPAGHVAFVTGWSSGSIRVIGGNQGNAVSEATFSTSELLGLRWPESVPNLPESEPVLATPAPAGPLKKSGTIWGSVGAFFAGISLYLEQAFSTLVQAGAALTELGPAQGLLASVGANTKALSLGLLVMCVGVVISRRVKAKQEGKAG